VLRKPIAGVIKTIPDSITDKINVDNDMNIVVLLT